MPSLDELLCGRVRWQPLPTTEGHVGHAIGERPSSPHSTAQSRTSPGTRHRASRRSAPAVPGLPPSDRWLIASRVFITSRRPLRSGDFEAGAGCCIRSNAAVHCPYEDYPLSDHFSVQRYVGLSGFPPSTRFIAKKQRSTSSGRSPAATAHRVRYFGIMLLSAASSRSCSHTYSLRREVPPGAGFPVACQPPLAWVQYEWNLCRGSSAAHLGDRQGSCIPPAANANAIAVSNQTRHTRSRAPSTSCSQTPRHSRVGRPTLIFPSVTTLPVGCADTRTSVTLWPEALSRHHGLLPFHAQLYVERWTGSKVFSRFSRPAVSTHPLLLRGRRRASSQRELAPKFECCQESILNWR